MFIQNQTEFDVIADLLHEKANNIDFKEQSQEFQNAVNSLISKLEDISIIDGE